MRDLTIKEKKKVYKMLKSSTYVKLCTSSNISAKFIIMRTLYDGFWNLELLKHQVPNFDNLTPFTFILSL
jgi:hypothetical protein